MATENGTFSCADDLLVKLNTFLVANSWTKLQGETDQACASPKSAQYWRILVVETQLAGDDLRELRTLHLRTTTGGANVATTAGNFSISSVATGGGADLISGSAVTRSADIDDDFWTITYDFGSGTVVRELVMQAETANRAPRNFYVQWSNDGKTWCTMASYSGQSWSALETKTFTWDSGSGYTDSRHVSGTQARRSGRGNYQAGISASELTLNRLSERCDNVWCWQGPGYDADRRVYFSALTYQDSVSGDAHIAIVPHTEYDSGVVFANWLEGQTGSPADNAIGPTYLLVDGSNGGEYWFFLNSTRLIIVVRNGVTDYTCAYVGFLASFANPDDWPFPLYVGGTTNDLAVNLSTTNSGVRDAVDPGAGGSSKFRRWDNVWRTVGNHEKTGGVSTDPVESPDCFVWPYHSGLTTQADFPNTVCGSWTGFNNHFLDHVDPTEQGDLPFFPAIVVDKFQGNVGALDGVFCVPGGGVLSPEQEITISSVDYLVFPTRSLTDGMNFYAVRAD